MWCFSALFLLVLSNSVQGWLIPATRTGNRHSPTFTSRLYESSNGPAVSDVADTFEEASSEEKNPQRKVTIIGAGWGGLSAAHALSKEPNVQVTLIEASPRVGGLVRDGFTTIKGSRPAEAGQHGFWNNYHNIYRLLRDDLSPRVGKDALTEYAEQGQYSPNGLEAVWPVYRDQSPPLPTGLAQAAYTRFLQLPWTDLVSAFPLVLAFSEFDDSPEAWERYDRISFRDLCIKLGVSERCYQEAFEPMILTGLFAPGGSCSAAAALGMAYFFVLQSQNAFDVQWCRGNIGDVFFTPWVEQLKEKGVQVECSTKVSGFDIDTDDAIRAVRCQREDGTNLTFETDDVILAVGAKALNAFVRFCPELARYDEFRGFSNLRGTSVLATRLFLDRNVRIPYSANACWGFDKGVGMTMFDIRTLHGDDAPAVSGCPGSVIEVDYYHANKLLVMSDDDIMRKAKKDIDTILGFKCQQAQVVDAAVVRLPEGVNWYFPGSYEDMPNIKSESISNLFYAGDIVKTRHGSWSQEKAFVTGIEASNLLLGRPVDHGVLPMSPDESHVKLGRNFIASFQKLITTGGILPRAPSLADFFR